MTKHKAPSEHTEQVAVVRWLKLHHLKFFAVPNGGKRARKTALSLKAEGLQPGVPDLLIVDPIGQYVGVALEMKRSDGTPSNVSPKQREWLAALQTRGWLCLVGWGADDAIKKLVLAYELGIPHSAAGWQTKRQRP